MNFLVFIFCFQKRERKKGVGGSFFLAPQTREEKKKLFFRHNFFFRLLQASIAFLPPPSTSFHLQLSTMAFAVRSAARPALASRRSAASAAAPRRVSVVRAEAENNAEAAAPAAAPTPVVQVSASFRSFLNTRFVSTFRALPRDVLSPRDAIWSSDALCEKKERFWRAVRSLGAEVISNSHACSNEKKKTFHQLYQAVTTPAPAAAPAPVVTPTAVKAPTIAGK